MSDHFSSPEVGAPSEHPSKGVVRALHTLTNDLSRATNVCDLALLAVRGGRERLRLSRLAVWLREGDTDLYRGTYGIDEQGNLRDEQAAEHETPGMKDLLLAILDTPAGVLVQENEPLRDQKAQITGTGVRLLSPLYDGERINGYLSVDDLLAPGQFDDEMIDAVGLFAATLGHMLRIKMTEERLRASEARYRQIVDLSPLGIAWHDRERRCLSANPAYCRIFGRTHEEVIGQDYVDLKIPEGRRAEERAYFEKLLATPQTRMVVENTNLRGDGTKIVVRYFIEHTYDNEGNVSGVVEYGEDITKRLQEEQGHRRLEEQMRQTQKIDSLGVLAGGIAHDFNNLLMGIIGNADLVLEELTPQSPARVPVHEIMTASRRAAELSRQMLAYSGKGRFWVETVNLNGLVRELGALMRVSIVGKCTLTYDLTDSPVLIKADAGQLRQVLMNLIMNASESMQNKQGDVVLRTGRTYCNAKMLSQCVLGDERQEGEYAYFQVVDSGNGIAPDIQKRIFDPFFTTKFTGRGLGLAAVLGIVRAHDGAIQLDSLPESGTSFTVYLPDSDRKVADTKPAGNVQTVLVVDDEERVRDLVEHLIERLGYGVLQASGGAEALEIIEQKSGDMGCVILDMNMPGMGGPETFRRLREVRSDMPVVVCTGSDVREAHQLIPQDERTMFLQKPVPLNTWRRVLKVMMESEKRTPPESDNGKQASET